MTSALQGALKDGFGEAVIAHDMPKPREFPVLDSYQKRLFWPHKKIDLTSHPVVGLVFQLGDAEKFPQALGLENLDSFLRFSKQDPCLTDIEEDGHEKRLVQLELASKDDGVASPYLV